MRNYTTEEKRVEIQKKKIRESITCDICGHVEPDYKEIKYGDTRNEIEWENQNIGERNVKTCCYIQYGEIYNDQEDFTRILDIDICPKCIVEKILPMTKKTIEDAIDLW